ncbi:MAG TPA: alpha/beta fold hydrolase [Gaiellaceae bacterium]|nr:alpha/beta fold hydrolase [Gaiellaceae bacterium]
MPPQTRYVRSGDASIAYQVFGEGPFDLVLILPMGSHVELSWDVPALRELNERLATFARVITFDKRGTGLSDRAVGFPSAETRMDDIRAVMDAAGSQRAAIMGWSEGVRLSLLFAATYPDRAWALVSYGGHAGSTRPRDELLRELAELREVRERDMAGTALEEARSGSPTASAEEQAALARMFRHSLSPGDEYAYERMNVETDVRHVLSAIAIPTLVLQNADDRWVPNDRARDLADRIPGARYAEVPISGHIPALADVPLVVDAIESFLQETWEADALDQEPDRILVTVLFTDIVDSTARMAEAGDRAWRELLERHHAIVRSQLARARGREVDTAGDGFFASFDARHAPSAAPRRSSTECASSVSRFARGSTRANASSSTARSRASPCTRERA